MILKETYDVYVVGLFMRMTRYAECETIKELEEIKKELHKRNTTYTVVPRLKRVEG